MALVHRLRVAHRAARRPGNVMNFPTRPRPSYRMSLWSRARSAAKFAAFGGRSLRCNPSGDSMSDKKNIGATDDRWRETWKSETMGKPYGDLFFARATGELPEMDLRKAAAHRIAALAKRGDSLLDVGCGGGHYYRSLKDRVRGALRYTGLDATPYYIERAREAFKNDAGAHFVVGEIFAIDFPDFAFDVARATMCWFTCRALRAPSANSAGWRSAAFSSEPWLPTNPMSSRTSHPTRMAPILTKPASRSGFIT